MKNRGKSILFGLLFMVVNLVMVFIFGQITELTCTKPESNLVKCTAERQLLGIVTVSTREFVGVNAAGLDSSCDEDGCTYRVILTTNKGQEPLTGYYSSGQNGKLKIVEGINDYAGTQKQTEPLNLQESSGLWAALMSFGFSLFGLYLIIVKGIFAPGGEETN